MDVFTAGLEVLVDLCRKLLNLATGGAIFLESNLRLLLKLVKVTSCRKEERGKRKEEGR